MQIVVLGMHRSGTSALVRLLSLAGCWIGSDDDFHDADDANPRGYWEHKEVWGLDSDLLNALGGDWDEVPDFSLDRLDDAARQTFAARAREIVARLDTQAASAPSQAWAIKDPRLCLTLPLWQPALPRAVAVFALRSPLSIARSIARRDDYPLAVGLALWEQHLRAALTATAQTPRIAIHFEDLLDSPHDELARLVERLRALGVRLHDPDPAAVSGFLDRTLERERREPDLEPQLLSHKQLALRDALCDSTALAAGRDGGALSPLAADLLRHHAKTRRAWKERLAEIEAFHARVTRDIQAYETEHSARLELETAYREEHTARLDAEHEAVQALAAEASARLRAEAQAAELHALVATLHEKIAEDARHFEAERDARTRAEDYARSLEAERG